MPALAIYRKRFSTVIADNDINSTAAAIDIAHTDVMHLLDLIIESAEARHFNDEHVYAAARAAMARLAEVEVNLEAVMAFCAQSQSVAAVSGRTGNASNVAD
jgi:hypothetical protein